MDGNFSDNPDLSGLDQPNDRAQPFRLGRPFLYDGFMFADGRLPQGSQWDHAIDVYRRVLPLGEQTCILAFDVHRGTGGLDFIGIGIEPVDTDRPLSESDTDVIVDVALTLGSAAAQTLEVPTEIVRLMTADSQIADALARRTDLWLHVDTAQQDVGTEYVSLTDVVEHIIQRLTDEEGNVEQISEYISRMSTFLGAEVSKSIGLSHGIGYDDLVRGLRDTHERLVDTRRKHADGLAPRRWMFLNVSPDDLVRMHRAWVDEHLETSRDDVREVRDTARELLRNVFDD